MDFKYEFRNNRKCLAILVNCDYEYLDLPRWIMRIFAAHPDCKHLETILIEREDGGG